VHLEEVTDQAVVLLYREVTVLGRLLQAPVDLVVCNQVLVLIIIVNVLLGKIVLTFLTTLARKIWSS